MVSRVVPLVFLLAGPSAAFAIAEPLPPYRERVDQPLSANPATATSPAARVVHGSHVSTQVNVNGAGLNIVGDAANETSIAVDPTDPGKISIGWRQFDSIGSNFREAGVGWSSDGGETWTASVIQNGTFRSDPVLSFDEKGAFYYYSLRVEGSNLRNDLFLSTNGGASWSGPVDAFGGDKAWLVTDRDEAGGSEGLGHHYATWSYTFTCCGVNTSFNRSIDRGATFEQPVVVPERPQFGTVAVGPDGEVYAAGLALSDSSRIAVIKSTTLQVAAQPPAFQTTTVVDLGGTLAASNGPNPAGLLGQIWVDVDRSNGPRRGWVYLVASLDPPGVDPADIFFARSTDGGATFGPAVRLSSAANGYQWFGMMAVDPEGGLDVVWNDSRNAVANHTSDLRHVHSRDGGTTWTAEDVLTPTFNPTVGWPQQNKIGDYYHMLSDAAGVHIAYSATFNGEQDVYYLRLPLGGGSLFEDGFESGSTADWTSSAP